MNRKPSRRPLLVPAVTVLALGAVGAGERPARAFSEDLCVKAGVIVDCMQAQSCAGGDTAGCSANVTWDAGLATTLGNGRSMLHVDSTYAIAQAVGFRWDLAYWIAAYNEVTDQGKYDPVDRCGRALNDATLTPVPITGFVRTQPATGGIGYHYVTPFSASGAVLPHVDGEHPDLSDTQVEGTLTHIRRWLYAGQGGAGAAPMCTDGFTSRVPASGAPFMNNACYADGAPVRYIRGETPLFSPGQARVPFNAQQGSQVLMTDSASGQTYSYGDLGALLASGTGELKAGSDAGGAVPEVLAKAGFYIHILQDRISHAFCTDVSFIRYSAPFYEYLFEPGTSDPTQCTLDQHAMGHYYEIGQATLPERTYSALEYTYDELKRLADTLRPSHPEWFTSRYAAPVTRAQLIRGQSGAPGALTTALTRPTAQGRLADLQLRVFGAYALTPMPGHGPSVSCR